jgi:hypothetical protein
MPRYASLAFYIGLRYTSGLLAIAFGEGKQASGFLSPLARGAKNAKQFVACRPSEAGSPEAMAARHAALPAFAEMLI